MELNKQAMVEKINQLTRDKPLNRKRLYEHLISSGTVPPNTERLVYELIEDFLNDGLVPRSCIKRWKKKSGKLPQIFTREQLAQMFDTCQRPKLAVAMWLGLFCGLRIREACNLRVKDLNLHQGKLMVRDSKNTNRTKQGYGKDRIVTIPELAISPLQKWLQVVQGGEWILPSMQNPNKPIRTKTIHMQYRQLLDECGMSNAESITKFKQKNHGSMKRMHKTTYEYRFHTLRHTYASYLREKGVPMSIIQETLGHESIDTTMIYAKISNKQRQEKINDAFSHTRKIVQPEQQFESAIPSQPGEDAIAILRKRLARGEIDPTTYKKLMAELDPERAIHVIHTNAPM